jgi:hypothetical protein
LTLRELTDAELARRLDQARADIVAIASGGAGGRPEIEDAQERERAVWDERMRRARERGQLRLEPEARTIAAAFGPEVADRLARWAIDALCEPPADIATYMTRIRADFVREGRALLEEAGIDWRALKGDARSRLASRTGGK